MRVWFGVGMVIAAIAERAIADLDPCVPTPDPNKVLRSSSSSSSLSPLSAPSPMIYDLLSADAIEAATHILRAVGGHDSHAVDAYAARKERLFPVDDAPAAFDAGKTQESNTGEVSPCCKLGLISSLCGEQNGDDDGVVSVSFDLSGGAPAVRSRRGEGVGSDAVTSGKVAVNSRSWTRAPDMIIPGADKVLHSFFRYDEAPSNKFVNIQASYYNTSTGLIVCNDFQMISNVGKQVTFDLDTECAHPVFNNRYPPFLMCSKRITQSAFSTQFYYGLISLDGTRTFQLKYIVQGYSEDIGLYVAHDCNHHSSANPASRENDWSISGKVIVYENPHAMRRELAVLDFLWSMGTRGTPAPGAFPLPG